MGAVRGCRRRAAAHRCTFTGADRGVARVADPGPAGEAARWLPRGSAAGVARKTARRSARVIQDDRCRRCHRRRDRDHAARSHRHQRRRRHLQAGRLRRQRVRDRGHPGVVRATLGMTFSDLVERQQPGRRLHRHGFERRRPWSRMPAARDIRLWCPAVPATTLESSAGSDGREAIPVGWGHPCLFSQRPAVPPERPPVVPVSDWPWPSSSVSAPRPSRWRARPR